jgi:signal peptidase I
VKTQSKSPVGQLVELVVIVALALGLAVAIQAFLVKPYRIPSGSMIPTLTLGQRVLVNRIGERFGGPSVGDVVVFHPPAGAETNTCGARGEGQDTPRPCGRPVSERSSENFIKRVVAGPGDTVAISGGHAIVNGKRQADSFTRPCSRADADCDFPRAVKIPPGYYFMMGDNRGASDDSRYWGPVPRKWIIGGAFATYWPPNRIGTL